ncbi:MAG: hypothetical protein AB1611_07995 [bacterium]
MEDKIVIELQHEEKYSAIGTGIAFWLYIVLYSISRRGFYIEV